MHVNWKETDGDESKNEDPKEEQGFAPGLLRGSEIW